MNNPVLYILMRDDLPSMNAGKAMAQASHAANAFIHKYGRKKDVKLWQKQTKQGFGTVIVLSSKLSELKSTVEKAYIYNCLSSLIIDPTYPYSDGNNFFTRKEITCGYVFGKKEDAKQFVHYQLYP